MGVLDAAGRDRITPDPMLTNVSIAFAQQTEYISDVLFPTVRVGKQSGRYRVFGRRDFASLPFGGDVRAPGSRANEIEAGVEWNEDTFFATEHALEIFVTDEERENYDTDWDADSEAVETVTDKLLIGKELAARDLLYDTTQYKSDHVVTLTAGQHFDEYGTSDPITVFRTAFRTFHRDTGLLPNLGVIPWTVMSYLEDHPDITARYQNQDGVVTAEQVANVLGLPRVLVPGGVFNSTSNPAQAAVLTDIWTDNIILGYVPPRPARNVPALGYEFLWPVRGGRRQQWDIVVDRRRDADRIGDIHRARRRYDLKLVGRDPELAGAPLVAGYLIRDVLSPAA